MHKSKLHLRQRHGSDALRLERIESPQSPSLLVIDDDDTTYVESTGTSVPTTPGRLESQRGRGGSYFTTLPKASPKLQTQPSSLGLPYDASKLPTGANTPVDGDATNQFPVVTYPPPPPTWSNMPNKAQLAILCLSRFVDFFQMAALQTYMVHQLKSFNPSLPDSTISHQAGVLQGSFTAAQIITSILWGRAADQPGVGRKLVLLIGLWGTGLSCIGVGFSKSYGQAVVWRMLGGAINGTVGSARTMVAECVDKRWHPRAFLLLPAAFNVANVAGPSTFVSNPGINHMTPNVMAKTNALLLQSLAACSLTQYLLTRSCLDHIRPLAGLME